MMSFWRGGLRSYVHTASHKGTGEHKMKPHNEYWQFTSKQMDTQIAKTEYGQFFPCSKKPVTARCHSGRVKHVHLRRHSFTARFAAQGGSEESRPGWLPNSPKPQRQAESGQSLAWEW